ncbi:hypothetical protein Acor_68920 [Acrocarpospora corrugata]|uniref:Right handed beta helix domain-containing protein n=1 Tax=Acrocarpospora corrugata TaxID=35763 RepID=A0A5M3W7M8_9ACTN|nr:hypothetical protein [Acrocarpospora corrugata]GES04824.1 hypothetical protein Acor_68920 [Acrocarpospora corrugata]
MTPGTQLTVINGDQTFATDGQTITGREFRGFVKVTGANITFKDCVFRGGSTNRTIPLFDSTRGRNTVVTDSEFNPANPSPGIDGAWTRNTQILRSEFRGSTDGLKAGSGTVLQDSYIHELRWFASDPDQNGGPTHNDGVQSLAGESSVTLRHNTIDLTTSKDANAALQSSAPNTTVVDNYLDGGGCTLNFSHNGLNGSLTGIKVTGNQFGRNSFFDCPILISTRTTLTELTGNVFADTNRPIPQPERHD